MISYETKRKCVEQARHGKKYSEIYSENIKPVSTMSFRSFARRIAEWKQKVADDDQTLEAANLSYKFAPYASTVQVNGNGEVVQAWIKQHTEDRLEELLCAIKENTPHAVVEPKLKEESHFMLEIPLFDMHFGIASFDFYKETLESILWVVESKHWDRIVIPVGQDLFHNDSITKGVTTKGTLIEKVDLKQATYDAKSFYFCLIDTAIRNANTVEVIYTPGNHDKTVGWFFMQILKERYGSIVDDSARERKAVWWNGCFIGFTHGDKGNDTAAGLRGKFTKEFPALYATAQIREVHIGHLHRESESRDEYGVQIRRLCTKNKDDEWTDAEGFMSQKRFMLFEWAPGKLKSIHYV
jgi:hypothetical protein